MSVQKTKQRTDSEAKQQTVKLAWHPAFYAGLQIELEEDASILEFENEHQLSTQPMEIDVLVIKKDSNVAVKKNIGRCFRKHNIIEYKSPDDYLSIDDYYKVYGYCCFYKADKKPVNSIKLEELTISFFCSKYPRELITHLEDCRGYKITCIEDGIYQVEGDVIQTQIIVTTKLSMEQNLWLRGLTNNLQKADMVEKLLKDYRRNKKNPLYESVMNIIVRANAGRLEEAKDMCEALRELMKDEIEESVKLAEARGEARGKAIGEERGEKKVNDLIAFLLKAGRLEDIAKSVENKEYQLQLFQEFGL